MKHELDQPVLERIVEQIVQALNPEKTILFGSDADVGMGPRTSP